MLCWPNGAFGIEEGVRPMEQTIERHWHGLLIEAAHRADELSASAPEPIPAVQPLHAIPMPAHPISQTLADPEILAAAQFTEDGTMLTSKGEDAETLQSTFAYVVQLSRLIGASLGAENLHEVNFVGPDRKALCVSGDINTSVVITTPKSNLAQFARKLA